MEVPRLPALALVLLLAGLGALHHARAQCGMLLCGAGKGPAGGEAVAYAGPIDAAGVSASGAWGLRCLRTAYCGGNLANVCTVIATVDTCLDFASNATTGDLVIVTIGGLACSSVTCTVKTLYDQSGGSACSGACNATQATVASRPTLVTSCIGSLPCMRGAAGLSLSTPILGANLNQPNWISGVAVRTASFTTAGAFLGGGGSSCLFNNSANTVLNYSGTALTAAATDSVLHAIQCIMNGTSSELYVDGSNTTGNAGTGALPMNQSLLISSDSFANVLRGDIGEAILFNSAPNTTQKSNVNSNQHTYWGF